MERSKSKKPARDISIKGQISWQYFLWSVRNGNRVEEKLKTKKRRTISEMEGERNQGM